MPIMYLRHAAFVQVTRADLSLGLLAAGRSNADGARFSPPRIARPRGLGAPRAVQSPSAAAAVTEAPVVSLTRGRIKPPDFGTHAREGGCEGVRRGAYTSSEETRGSRSRGVWKTPLRRAWLRRVRSVSGCGGPPHNRPRGTKPRSPSGSSSQSRSMPKRKSLATATARADGC